MPTNALPFGQWATVIVDGLRVRMFAPGLDEASETSLSAGDSIFFLGPGAIALDGYQWYEVAHGAVVGNDGKVHADGLGWIAGTSSDGSVRHVEDTVDACPDPPIDAETLSGLTGWAMESCGLGSFTGLEGILNQPIHGPLSPFTYEPTWLSFSSWFLTDPEEAEYSFILAGWSVGLHFPPEFDTTSLRRGDIVRINGHINDAAADQCRIIGSIDPGGPEPSDGAQAAFQLGCSVKLVVDELEVLDHIELPSP